MFAYNITGSEIIQHLNYNIKIDKLIRKPVTLDLFKNSD